MYSDLPEIPFIKNNSPVWGDELIQTRRSFVCKKKRNYRYMEENDFYLKNGKYQESFKKSRISESSSTRCSDSYEINKDISTKSLSTSKQITRDEANFKNTGINPLDNLICKSRSKSEHSLSKVKSVKPSERNYRSYIRSISPSYDSVEEYRRSRSREKKRRHQQFLTIQKYCKSSGEESQVFWDGFQWVKKGHGSIGYDQLMNATRRARRLHIGNLPTHITLNEEDFRLYFWGIMRLNRLCHSEDVCPIVHVWFAKDRGGNFGFIEMASVEEAIAALQLDGTIWHGSPITINRPTDWKKSLNDQAIRLMAGTSGLAAAESVAAASQQALTTGNSFGLVSVLSKLPEMDRLIIQEMIKNQNISLSETESEVKNGLPVQLVKNKIRAELLTGVPSRIVKIIKPFSKLGSNEEFKDVLEDVMQECSKYGGIIAALIINNDVPTSENSNLGDIFLEFASISQADNCIFNLTGRLYEGRPVQLIRFSEYSWKQNLKCYSENLFKRKMEMIKGFCNSH